MTRHFEKSFRFNPRGYMKSETKVWNAFVAFTHKIGLKSFQFSPPYRSEYTYEDFDLPPKSGENNNITN